MPLRARGVLPSLFAMSEETHDQAPALPEIRDEAADSPVWVPILGLVLLVLIAVTFALRGAISESLPEVGPAAVAPAPAAPAAH